jgi:hypothetical protein
MKTQVANGVWDPKWKVYFYKKQVLKTPIDDYDCSVNCFYMEEGICHFYTFKDQVCYFGNFNQLTGDVAVNVDLTLNLVSFKKCK